MLSSEAAGMPETYVSEHTSESHNFVQLFMRFAITRALCGFEGLSLMLYGSFVRGDWQAGRSDIDAVLIFPDDVVTDKKRFRDVSRIVSEALCRNPIPFQVTLTDLETMRDGRFNSYNPSFQPYFERERRVVVGPDYNDQFRFEMPTHPEQEALRFNLRKSRQGLLLAEHDRTQRYERFIERFTKALDATSRGSKQILFMVDDCLRLNRFSALTELPLIFPEVNLEPLERIRHLYHHLDELDALYQKPEDVIALWSSTLTFFEEVIRGYIRRVPQPERKI